MLLSVIISISICFNASFDHGRFAFRQILHNVFCQTSPATNINECRFFHSFTVAIFPAVSYYDIEIGKLSTTGCFMQSRIIPNCEFVVDESRTDDGCNGVVYGIVTDKYLGYSNNQLLKDAEYAIKGSSSSEQLILKEAVSINSKIRLRFLSNKFSGIIRGYDDSCKEDVTRIGLELSNSMCGESSVIFKYFLYRLLCSNGLTVKSEDEVRRIIHIGKQSRFRREIEDNIVAMASGFSKTMDFISNLSELEFNPTKLARLFGGDKCLSIIPDSKQILRSLYSIDQNEFQISKKELTSEIKKQMKECETEFYISKLPEVFACDISRRVFDFRYRENASMFDFINVFTEYANHLSSPAHKIGIQERTGDFANWLKKNKKSFITN